MICGIEIADWAVKLGTGVNELMLWWSGHVSEERG